MTDRENSMTTTATAVPMTRGRGRVLLALAYSILAVTATGYSTTAFAVDLQLVGDTSCAWGSKDCNRCVNDVKTNFDNIETSYTGELGSQIGVRSYAYPTKDYLLNRMNALGAEHIQGVGRIAGLGNNEYLVFTHSTKSDDPGKSGALAVVRMGASQSSKGFALGDMREGDGKDQNTQNRTVARTYSDSNHPGGLATLGHYVFVADWCQPHGNYKWCHKRSQYAFEVYDVSEVHRNAVLNSHPPVRIIDRSVKIEGDEKRQASTATVAATRLRDGHYLVGIGRSGGQNYEYFLSDTTQLLPTTAWSSLGDPDPIQKWGEGAAMVNECGTGDVYLVQIEKSADKLYDTQQSKDELHLFKLEQVSNSPAIRHNYIKSRTFRCSDGTAWCDFDKGGGLYVSPKGNLYLYATDAQQAKSTERFRMVEFGNYLETNRRNEVVPARRGRPSVVDHRTQNTGAPRRNETVPARRGVMPAPSDATISEVGRTSLRLNWMDNATVEYGVAVDRGIPVEDRGGINYQWKHAFNVEERVMSRVQGKGWRTDVDDQLEPDTEYCYRLRAYRKSEYSDYSTLVCARTDR
jgi:hypothetical protein